MIVELTIVLILCIAAVLYGAYRYDDYKYSTRVFNIMLMVIFGIIGAIDLIILMCLVIVECRC